MSLPSAATGTAAERPRAPAWFDDPPMSSSLFGQGLGLPWHGCKAMTATQSSGCNDVQAPDRTLSVLRSTGSTQSEVPDGHLVMAGWTPDAVGRRPDDAVPT
jgi:hypothetical protein